MKSPILKRFLIVVGLVLGGAILLFPFLSPNRRRNPAGQTRPQLASQETESLSIDSISTPISNETENAQESSNNEAQEQVSQVTTSDPIDAWSRFRGPNGQGISDDTKIPLTWSDSENLSWKTDLPGAGASSPVLTEHFVFVTSYSGYGLSANKPGEMKDLSRHISCIERASGKILWTQSVPAVLPEDRYQGMGVPEHGYATNTPVTDGKRVYVFFGKAGVFAFDLNGEQLWRATVGTESGNRGWGTASSLILHNNILIVNASEESNAIYGLDCETGNKLWNASASLLELAYGTPIAVPIDEKRTDIVIAVPEEVWGLDPSNGKLRWFASMKLTGNVAPSVVVDDSMMYIFGGYNSSGSLAIRKGGSGDISKSHIAWTSRNSSYVATPVLYQGRLYWINDRGMAYCEKADSGELVYRERVEGMSSGGRPVYASPILIGDKIYVQTRESGLFVLEASEQYKVLARNSFESDKTIFNATPAVSRGQLFLRSDKALYCISQK
jgi:outer membrane protein assembly factor BamB